MTVDANENKINRFLKSMKQEILHGSSAEEVLKKIGTFQKGLIQEQIVKGSFAPNAESTVRKKGSNKPLVDTGRMRQSVNYVIQKKGSGDN